MRDLLMLLLLLLHLRTEAIVRRELRAILVILTHDQFIATGGEGRRVKLLLLSMLLLLLLVQRRRERLILILMHDRRVRKHIVASRFGNETKSNHAVAGANMLAIR